MIDLHTLWDGGDLPAVSDCALCDMPVLAGEPEAHRVVGSGDVEIAHATCAARRRSWRDAAILNGDDMSRYTVEVQDADGFSLERRGFVQRPAAEAFRDSVKAPNKAVLTDEEEAKRAADRIFLQEIGEALFGGRWQRSVADLLGVNERRLREWVAGEKGAIPATIWGELSDELLKRASLCKALSDRSKARSRKKAA